MEINFFGLKRFYEKYHKDITNVIHQSLSEGKFLDSAFVQEFENKLCQICNRKFAITVGSCTDALYFALSAAGIKPGDEIIITSFSFIASVSPILRIGAVPVFTDISEYNYMMDLSVLEQKITKKTKAIVVVHLFGQMLSPDKIESFAQKHNLIVIEDAAQAFGSKFDKKPAGNMGSLSCLSFDPTKIIGAFGSGGAVLTDDENTFQYLKKIKYHGKNFLKNDYELTGYNSRISSLQAGLLNFQLTYLEKWIEQKNSIARWYNSHLKTIDEVSTPEAPNLSNKHSFHKYVIKAKNRNDLASFLKKEGISTQIHYPKALFEYSLFKKHPYKAVNCKTVKQVTDTVLSLPIYPELKTKEIEYICKKIKQFYQK